MMLWVIIGLALIKVPIAALMLWLPFRADERMIAPDAPDADSEEPGGGGGGGAPRRPRSPRPRRGPHGLPPQAPSRVRTPGVRGTPSIERTPCAGGKRPIVPRTPA
jgi:hypothetical protein